MEELNKKETILRCLEEFIQDEERVKEFSKAVDRDRNLTNLCMQELVSAYISGHNERVSYFIDFLAGIRNDVELGVDVLDRGYVGPEAARYLRGSVLTLLGKITLAQQYSKHMGTKPVSAEIRQLIEDSKNLTKKTDKSSF